METDVRKDSEGDTGDKSQRKRDRVGDRRKST
jgi:hypothetical protein